MPRLLRPSGRDSWCWWQKEMHLRPLSSLAPEDLPTAMAREMAQHKQGQQRTRKKKRAADADADADADATPGTQGK